VVVVTTTTSGAPAYPAYPQYASTVPVAQTVSYGGVAPPAPPGTTTVYTTTTTTTSGGRRGHAAHGAHAAHVAPPTAVVVTQPAPAGKSKTKRMVCLYVCLVIAALVLCLTLVPWPGTRDVELYPNEQVVVYANGLFIEALRLETASGDLPLNVKGYTRYPELSLTYYGPLEGFFTPQQGVRDLQINTFLPFNSVAALTVPPVSAGACDTTSFSVYVFRGKGRYEDFLYYSIINAHATWSFFPASGLPEVRTTVNSDDVYYFVLYNPSCPNMAAQQTLSVRFESRTYQSPEAPVFTCTTGDCTDYVPYGEYRYYIAEVPYDGEGTNTYRSRISLDANDGAYIGLYVGVFGSLCLCGTLALVASKRKQRAAASQQDVERDSLLAHAQGQQVRPGPACCVRRATGRH
jgi:hypothetical protein